MSNQLIHMDKVRLIIELYTKGVAKKTITEKSGCSRNTVKKYIREYIALGINYEEFKKLTNKELEKHFKTESIKSEKLKELEKFFPTMEKRLKRKGATREQLWNEYITEHPDGYRLSQFKEHYRRWQKVVNSVMHIEHKAGDKMYVDYAGNKLEIVDPDTGELRKVEVFVSVLGASQYTYVEASYSQRKEDFIKSCENALHYYQGVPAAIVPDNLKAAVTRSDRYEPTLNESFHQFVMHYGMAALPAGAYRPTHKALAEGMVKIIYRSIYVEVRKQSYTSLEDLNKAIWKELEKLNNRLMNVRPYSRGMLFEEIEKSELQPLPELRFDLRHKKSVTVMKNNHVCLSEDKHYYSVPFENIGRKVQLLYNQTSVDIYCQYEMIASHKRDTRPYRYTTVKEHLASSHQFIGDWTPETFIGRAQKIGKSCEVYIRAVLEKPQHAEQAFKSCQGIINLAKKVGNDRLNKACERASSYQDYSYKTIKTILEKKLDKIDDDKGDDNDLPDHDNIRGKDYFE